GLQGHQSSLPGAGRDWETGGDDIFDYWSVAGLGAAHHRLVGPLRLGVLGLGGPPVCAKSLPISRTVPGRMDQTDMTDRPASAEGSGRARPRLGLSGKLLVLTLLFVMIAEVLIYVPSIANFRLNWLHDR